MVTIKLKTLHMKLRKIAGILFAVLALAGCGSGSGATPDTSQSGTGTGNGTTVSGYTLKVGETGVSGLNLSMIDGVKFYWAQEGTQYGAISFSNSNGTGSGTGAFSVMAPTPTSSSVTWNSVVILTNAMPIIVTDNVSLSTFNIIARASNYYVVSWTIANKTGTQFMRWYFGSGASTAAAAFAGNPAVTTQTTLFKTSDFSGKSFYWVGNTYYQQVVFNAGGTYSVSNVVTTGVPGTPVYNGTWSVAGGTLQLTNTFGTTTYTYNATVPLSGATYFRCIRDNGAINAFVYDANQINELAVAQALAIVGGPN